jgi:hypothetical protein
MADKKTLIVPRDKPFTLLLAADEHEFFAGLAEELGTTLSSVVRNAASSALMVAHDPLGTAREHHVTSLARVDRWRREREAKASGVSVPRATI